MLSHDLPTLPDKEGRLAAPRQRTVASPPRRPFAPPPHYERLFDLIAQLRAPTVASLHDLYFRRHFSTGGGELSDRSTRRRIGTLVRHGFLDYHRISGSAHQVVHLTHKGLQRFPELSQRYRRQVARVPVRDVAICAWVRSELWAHFARDGYQVGRDVYALLALRRSLVDRQRHRIAASTGSARADAEKVLEQLRGSATLLPLTEHRCPTCDLSGKKAGRCPTCGVAFVEMTIKEPYVCDSCRRRSRTAKPHGCKGEMRRSRRYLDFDVAHRQTSAGFEVVLLAVDDPYVAIDRQLQRLPLRHYGQPFLDVVVRPSDDESIWDAASKSWVFRGPRFRRLLSAFEPSSRSDAFPYWHSANVVNPYPDVAFRTVGHRRGPAHA